MRTFGASTKYFEVEMDGFCILMKAGIGLKSNALMTAQSKRLDNLSVPTTMQLSTFQWRLHILLSVFYFLAILYFVSAPVAVYGAPPVDYQGNPCELDAVYTERAPKIDGYIDKDLWSRGALATNFTQREPETGERVSERTGVRILYDDDNLYLLFICGDIEPDQMVANIMRRDQSLYQDDNVEIFLDPLHDHRTIFLFATNPLGARRDAIVTAEGRNFNDDWDGIWEVKTQVSTQGWVAEMKIPLETLRFVSGENMTWGLNFGRALQRDGEYAFWSPIRYTPSYRERYRAEHYGHLNGLRLTGSTKTLQIKPYAISGGDKDYVEENDWNFERDAGLDVKYGVTNQLTLDLTYNTDFAQVEADNEVVNLTRFNLFFPEKRDFFLEGAGLFNLSSAAPVAPPAIWYSSIHGPLVCTIASRFRCMGACACTGRLGIMT